MHIIFSLVLIAVIILIVGGYLRKYPEKRQRVKQFIYIAISVIIIIFLLRFGQHYLAAAFSFLAAIIPNLQRIFAVVTGVIGIKKWLEKNKAPSAKTMTKAQASAILGVDINASKKEIQAAYQNKMREHHPDKGGSHEDATKLNEAKECLLSDHSSS